VKEYQCKTYTMNLYNRGLTTGARVTNYFSIIRILQPIFRNICRQRNPVSNNPVSDVPIA
jgi:hypothetical protein